MSAFGTTWPVFLGLTLVLFGGAAWMTGQAVAGTWRPGWQIVPYGLLLAAADRFAGWALFRAKFGPPIGFTLDAAVLLVIAALAWQRTRACLMVRQYPWLYAPLGPFRWRVR